MKAKFITFLKNLRKYFTFKLDYRHYICSVIVIGIALFSIFQCGYAFDRLIVSFNDIKNSLLYYINELVDYPIFDVKVTVNEPLPINWLVFNILPTDLEIFKIKALAWVTSLINGENWLYNFAAILLFISSIMKWFLLFILLVPAVRRLWNNYYLPKEKKTSKSVSKPLIIHMWLSNHVYMPVYNWVKNFIGFVREHSLYYTICVLFVLYDINAYSIIISFFAWYFYFIMSFNFVSIYYQIGRLLNDISVLFKLYFIPLWAYIGITLFIRFTEGIGYSVMEHLERMNRGYINSLGNTIFVSGKTRKGKTTSIADFAISIAIMFRNKAYEKLMKIDLRWCNFPFVNLEMALVNAIEKHQVYNLATCKRFIKKCQRQFNRTKDIKHIFNYDFERYSLFQYDGLVEQYIWDALVDYAKLYFIYIFESSYIGGNMSVRTDTRLHKASDTQYSFPIVDDDIFHRDGRVSQFHSRRSHIIDQDAMRLVKTLILNNPKAHSVDFGIYVYSEVAKDRGNKETNKKVDTKDTLANQLNDGFELFMKMHGHSGTVDGYCFSVFLMDDQSPESLGADTRRLCTVLDISETDNDIKLALPFFSIRAMVCEWVVGIYEKLYFSRFKHNRNDNTLFIYLLKNLSSKLFMYKTKIENTFGYKRFYYDRQTGRLEGVISTDKYYIFNKKIYSDRFDTACFGDYFERMQLESEIGYADLPEFLASKATLEEMLLFRSYFINDLLFPNWRETYRKMNEERLMELQHQ